MEQKLTLKERIRKTNTARNFVKLFVDDRVFKNGSENSVLVEIAGFKFWVANKMVNYREKAKGSGKEYCSITVNRYWEYDVFQTRKLADGTYEDYNQRKMTGNDIIDNYWVERKKNAAKNK